ncbi:MAG: DNA-formamidopyrimidine glycosylase family protein [Dehalococcoidia bacterium]
MPEIPDLEAIRNFLTPRLRESTVASVDVRYPWTIRSTDGLDSIVGHRITEVTRIGKFLEFHLDDGRLLIVNAMLTGRFHWAEATDRKRPGTCVVIALEDGHELRYSDARRMGRWYITTPKDIATDVPQIGELGPDALRVEEDEFLARLKRHRGQAKNTLTNQRFIAGIGNAYSDEILWEAGVHPHRRIATLDDDGRRELYRGMRAVFDWAMPILEAEVKDGLYQRNEEWRDHLRVHRKAGEPCPRCGNEVKGQTRSGSETNYCLHCQPLF